MIELLDQLALDGSIQPFLVIADALIERGDAWGDVITEQCNGIVTDEQFVTLRARIGLSPSWGFAFERGFLRSAVYSAPAKIDTFAAELATLLALPIAHRLAALELRFARMPHVHVLLPHRARLAPVRLALTAPLENARALLAALDGFTAKEGSDWETSALRLRQNDDIARAFAQYDRAAEEFVDAATPAHKREIAALLGDTLESKHAARVTFDGGSAGTYRFFHRSGHYAYMFINVTRKGVESYAIDGRDHGGELVSHAQFLATQPQVFFDNYVTEDDRTRILDAVRAMMGELA